MTGSHGVQPHVKKKHMRLPAAGTKRRQMLAWMFSSEGLTLNKAKELRLVSDSSNGGLNATMNYFQDELFFDVRQIKTKGMKATVYFIAGRWDHKGRYIDYLAGRIK